MPSLLLSYKINKICLVGIKSWLKNNMNYILTVN